MTRSAKASPSRVASRKAGRPSVAFKWELLSEVKADVQKLLMHHWREVDIHHDDVPLDPDWDRYAQFEAHGWLGFLTARVGGKLVGYLSVIAGPHLHHKSVKSAKVDVMWLHPDYRHGWTGVRFVRHMEKGMRKLGVKTIWFAVKVHFKNERGRSAEELLKYLGFDYVEATYAKVCK